MTYVTAEGGWANLSAQVGIPPKLNPAGVSGSSRGQSAKRSEARRPRNQDLMDLDPERGRMSIRRLMLLIRIGKQVDKSE